MRYMWLLNEWEKNLLFKLKSQHFGIHSLSVAARTEIKWRNRYNSSVRAVDLFWFEIHFEDLKM